MELEREGASSRVRVLRPARRDEPHIRHRVLSCEHIVEKDSNPFQRTQGNRYALILEEDAATGPAGSVTASAEAEDVPSADASCQTVTDAFEERAESSGTFVPAVPRVGTAVNFQALTTGGKTVTALITVATTSTVIFSTSTKTFEPVALWI